MHEQTHTVKASYPHHVSLFPFQIKCLRVNPDHLHLILDRDHPIARHSQKGYCGALDHHSQPQIRKSVNKSLKLTCLFYKLNNLLQIIL